MSYLPSGAYNITQYSLNQIFWLADKIKYGYFLPLGLGYLTFRARLSQAIEVSGVEHVYLPHSLVVLEFL